MFSIHTLKCGVFSPPPIFSTTSTNYLQIYRSYAALYFILGKNIERALYLLT